MRDYRVFVSALESVDRELILAEMRHDRSEAGEDWLDSEALYTIKVGEVEFWLDSEDRRFLEPVLDSLNQGGGCEPI